MSARVCLSYMVYTVWIPWIYQPYANFNTQAHIKRTLLSSFLRSDWEQTLVRTEWANYIDINYNIINDGRIVVHIRLCALAAWSCASSLRLLRHPSLPLALIQSLQFGKSTNNRGKWPRKAYIRDINWTDVRHHQVICVIGVLLMGSCGQRVFH